MLEHDQDHAGGFVLISVSNLLITEMELRSIDISEVPAALRDPAKITKDMIRVDLMTPEEQQKLRDE